jgi:ArsR family transcriptional regulator, virulence genes transcriptional regulator
MTPDTANLAPLADEATALLKALAHPARLMICCQLKDREMSVGDMEETLGIKQPRLSRELGKLREEGLVETRRESKVVFYQLSDAPRLREMVDAVCAVMLGQTKSLPKKQPPRPAKQEHRPGGYGVFARPVS